MTNTSSSPGTEHTPDNGYCVLPFEYIDGPDYCEVKTATGANFALTINPALMKRLEQALREDLDRLTRPPSPAQIQQEPVGWFNPWNDYHGYQQVAKEFEGASGTIPLYAAPGFAQARGWQSIETAPKDGTDIYVWPYWGDGNPAQVHWRDMKRTLGRWEITPSFYCYGASPTHWHPVLASPASSTDKLCAKCGCETKGEAALVGDEVWCHPCADAQSDASTLHSDPPETATGLNKKFPYNVERYEE